MGEHHFKAFANNHLAFSYLKTEIEDLWNVEFEELDNTCKHRFRSRDDVNQWLIRYWHLAKGKFVPIGRYKKVRSMKFIMAQNKIKSYLKSQKIKKCL